MQPAEEGRWSSGRYWSRSLWRMAQATAVGRRSTELVERSPERPSRPSHLALNATTAAAAAADHRTCVRASR